MCWRPYDFKRNVSDFQALAHVYYRVLISALYNLRQLGRERLVISVRLLDTYYDRKIIFKMRKDTYIFKNLGKILCMGFSL